MGDKVVNRAVKTIFASTAMLLFGFSGCSNRESQFQPTEKLSTELSLSGRLENISMNNLGEKQGSITYTAIFALSNISSDDVKVILPPEKMYLVNDTDVQWSVRGDELSVDWQTAFGTPGAVVLQKGQEIRFAVDFSRFVNDRTEASIPDVYFVLSKIDEKVQSVLVKSNLRYESSRTTRKRRGSE